LEPSEGEQDKRYDERNDRAPGVIRDAEPAPRGADKEQDAKKSGDQGQGSVHRAAVRENRKFSVTRMMTESADGP